MHVESRLTPLNSIESNVYRFIFIGFSENNAVVLLFLDPKTSSKKLTHDSTFFRRESMNTMRWPATWSSAATMSAWRPKSDILIYMLRIRTIIYRQIYMYIYYIVI